MILKRSIILDSMTTSIGMEGAFWEEVDRRSTQAGMSWQDYTRQLLTRIADGGNRSASVRVALLRQLVEEVGFWHGPQIESWWRLRTPSASREFGLRGTRLTVGRSSDNDIVVADPEVSRRHFMLVFDGDFWRAVDLDSKDGFRIKGRRIEAARMDLETLVCFGDSELSLLY
jgi:predicted DNA-binding ribbon-helix-helix protein